MSAEQPTGPKNARGPISREAFEVRLAELCLRRGGPGLPKTGADRALLFKSVTIAMADAGAADHAQSEREINEVLKSWLADVGCGVEVDHVALRRAMVDEGWLVRSADGREYRGGTGTGAATAQFDPAIDGVDPRDVIRRAIETAAQRKRTRSGG